MSFKEDDEDDVVDMEFDEHFKFDSFPTTVLHDDGFEANHVSHKFGTLLTGNSTFGIVFALLPKTYAVGMAHVKQASEYIHEAQKESLDSDDFKGLDRELFNIVTEPMEGAFHMALSPDGEILLVAITTKEKLNKVALFDVPALNAAEAKTVTPFAELKGRQSGEMTRVIWHGDDKLLVLTGGVLECLVLNRKPGAAGNSIELKRFAYQSNGVSAVSSQDGKRIYCGHETGKLEILEASETNFSVSETLPVFKDRTLPVLSVEPMTSAFLLVGTAEPPDEMDEEEKGDDHADAKIEPAEVYVTVLQLSTRTYSYYGDLNRDAANLRGEQPGGGPFPRQQRHSVSCLEGNAQIAAIVSSSKSGDIVVMSQSEEENVTGLVPLELEDAVMCNVPCKDWTDVHYPLGVHISAALVDPAEEKPLAFILSSQGTLNCYHIEAKRLVGLMMVPPKPIPAPVVRLQSAAVPVTVEPVSKDETAKTAPKYDFGRSTAFPTPTATPKQDNQSGDTSKPAFSMSFGKPTFGNSEFSFKSEKPDGEKAATFPSSFQSTITEPAKPFGQGSFSFKPTETTDKTSAKEPMKSFGQGKFATSDISFKPAQSTDKVTTKDPVKPFGQSNFSLSDTNTKTKPFGQGNTFPKFGDGFAAASGATTKPSSFGVLPSTSTTKDTPFAGSFGTKPKEVELKPNDEVEVKAPPALKLKQKEPVTPSALSFSPAQPAVLQVEPPPKKKGPSVQQEVAAQVAASYREPAMPSKIAINERRVVSRAKEFKENKMGDSEVARRFSKTIALLDEEFMDMGALLNESARYLKGMFVKDGGLTGEMTKLLAETRALDDILTKISEDSVADVKQTEVLAAEVKDRFRTCIEMQETETAQQSAEYKERIKTKPLDPYSFSLKTRLENKLSTLQDRMDDLADNMHVEHSHYLQLQARQYEYAGAFGESTPKLRAGGGEEEYLQLVRVVNSNVDRLRKLEKHVHHCEVITGHSAKTSPLQIGVVGSNNAPQHSPDTSLLFSPSQVQRQLTEQSNFLLSTSPLVNLGGGIDGGKKSGRRARFRIMPDDDEDDDEIEEGADNGDDLYKALDAQAKKTQPLLTRQVSMKHHTKRQLNMQNSSNYNKYLLEQEEEEADDDTWNNTSIGSFGDFLQRKDTEESLLNLSQSLIESKDRLQKTQEQKNKLLQEEKKVKAQQDAKNAEVAKAKAAAAAAATADKKDSKEQTPVKPTLTKGLASKPKPLSLGGGFSLGGAKPGASDDKTKTPEKKKEGGLSFGSKPLSFGKGFSLGGATADKDKDKAPAKPNAFASAAAKNGVAGVNAKPNAFASAAAKNGVAAVNAKPNAFASAAAKNGVAAVNAKPNAFASAAAKNGVAAVNAKPNAFASAAAKNGVAPVNAKPNAFASAAAKNGVAAMNLKPNAFASAAANNGVAPVNAKPNAFAAAAAKPSGFGGLSSALPSTGGFGQPKPATNAFSSGAFAKPATSQFGSAPNNAPPQGGGFTNTASLPSATQGGFFGQKPKSSFLDMSGASATLGGKPTAFGQSAQPTAFGGGQQGNAFASAQQRLGGGQQQPKSNNPFLSSNTQLGGSSNLNMGGGRGGGFGQQPQMPKFGQQQGSTLGGGPGGMPKFGQSGGQTGGFGQQSNTLGGGPRAFGGGGFGGQQGGQQKVFGGINNQNSFAALGRGAQQGGFSQPQFGAFR